MSRFARIFLAAVFLPLVMIAAPLPAAQAAPGYGAAADITLEDSGVVQSETQIGYADLKCNIAARNKVSEGLTPGASNYIQEVVGNIWCKVDKRFVGDPHWGDAGDTSSWELSFSGARAGGSCGSTSVGTSFLTSETAFTGSGTIPADCEIDEVCFDWDLKDHFSFNRDLNYHFDVCEAVDLGTIPVPGDDSIPCEYGTPLKAFGVFYGFSVNGTNKWDYKWSLKTTDDLTSNDRFWRFEGYWSGYNPDGQPGFGGNDAWRETNTLPTGIYARPGWDGGRGDGLTATFFDNPPESNGTNGSPPASPEGFNVNVKGYPGETIGDDGRNFTTHPIGVTVPEMCIFWFGDKVVDLPNTDIDEPWAPIDTDVPPAEDPETPVDDPGADAEGDCDFDVTSPSTWLSGGMCALIGIFTMDGGVLDLLGDLIGAIGDLAGSILEGLGNLLQSLFIPDPDSWGVEELFDQLETKPPFSLAQPLMNEAEDFGGAFQTAGSCGTLADFGGDMQVSCSQVQNAPGMSQLYQLVRVALLAVTALGCFKLLSNLFQDGQ